jgi:hypothetical protein
MDRIGEDAAWEAGTLTAAEIEFLGEDELITVTPCFRMKAIKLMSVRVCESSYEYIRDALQQLVVGLKRSV